MPIKMKIYQSGFAIMTLISCLLAIALIKEHRDKIAVANELQSTKATVERTQIALQTTESNLSELSAKVKKTSDENGKAQAIQNLYGIYYCDASYNYKQLDLRSDGTSAWSYSLSGDVSKRGRWTNSGNTLSADGRSFTIERGDLIDDRSKRWVHVRH